MGFVRRRPVKPVGVFFVKSILVEQTPCGRPDRALAPGQLLRDRVERESITNEPDDRLLFLVRPRRAVSPMLRPLRRVRDHIRVGKISAHVPAKLKQLSNLSRTQAVETAQHTEPLDPCVV